MKKQRLARRQRRSAQLALQKRHKKRGHSIVLPDDRRGSAIIVVIALLSALMILGFFFLSLASQENENAEYFKETAKQIEPVEFDPDEAFDCYLKQLILGAEPHQYNSVFYGGRVSLLPTMFGTDLSPFNGEGVNTVWYVADGRPRPAVDLNYDGMADIDPNNDGIIDFPNADLSLSFNLMPGTQLAPGQNADTNLDIVNNQNAFIPEPDVDYVYPDHSFPMLTYVGYVPSSSETDGVDLVVIPSGHRPQLLRNMGAVGSTPAQWYNDPASRGYTFKAHQQRLAVREDGTVSTRTRFISALDPSDEGLNSYFTASGFPATPVEGMWQATQLVPFAGQDDMTGTINYEYEANPAGRTDPSGNPVNTAIYHDCDFPIIRDRNTNQNYAVLVSAEILDAEGLLNLNVIGNTNAVLAFGGTQLNLLGGVPRPMSTSNLGANPSEINPYYALLTDPSAENSAMYDFADYNDYMGFTPPLDATVNIPSTDLMANADWWSIVKGAPKISSGTVLEVYPGRYGEPEIARAAWETASVFGNYPNPGVSGADDNFNRSKNWFPNFGPTPPVRFSPQPVDHFGVGTRDTGSGKQRSFAFAGGVNRYPSYGNYAVNELPYRNHYGVTTMPASTASAGLALNDDVAEMVVDPSLANKFKSDSPFSPGESAGLQLSDTDLTNSGATSSLQELAPWSFRENDRAETIRRRFTTISHDLKTHSHRLYGSSSADDNNPYVTVPASRSRSWEWGDSDADGRVDFPRLIDLDSSGAIDGNDILNKSQPIRHALFELLFEEEAESQLLPLMRKLNVNGVTEFDRDFTSLRGKGYIRQRGLVPHSQGLLATQLSTQLSGIPNRNTEYQAFVNNVLGTVVSPGTTADQEFVARIDRQLLARDIYTLLYLYGHGDDSQDTYLDNSTRTIYSPEQCREMAQFAVNLVDYMDPDDVVTKFEYDVNLFNGWNLDDYPFAITGPGWGGDAANLPAGDRGVVFGVEEQQISFNEGLAVFAKEARQTASDSMSAKADHNWTEWNDGLHHAFLFMELQNTSGRVVTFDNNEWEVVVRPLEWDSGVSPDTEAGTPYGKRRHLILSAPSNVLSLSPGGNSSILGIGSVSNEMSAPVTYTGVNGNAAVNPAPSRMRVKDPANMTMGAYPAGLTDVAPVINSPDMAATDQYLDLALEGTLYQVFDESTNAYLTTNNASDPAERLLEFTDWDVVYSNLGTAGMKTYRVELVLRRRLNPARTSPNPADPVEEADNPWIVVDRKLLPLQDLNIAYNETNFNATHFNTSIQSASRYQPLYGVHGNDDIATLPRYTSNDQSRSYHSYNSIGVLNRDTANAGGEVPEYTLWHPHKNHEFLSLVDLFSVPLFGADGLDDPTAPLDDFDTMTPELDADPATGLGPWRGLTTKLGETIGGGNSTTAVLAGRDTFGHRVLNPWGEDGNPTTLADNNRWHRVLEFLEVPNEIHQSVLADGSGRFNAGVVGFNNVIGNVGGLQTVFYRRPGVLNLNTIRDPEVLAGLMDDPNVFTWNPLGTSLPEMQDNMLRNGRVTGDWWLDYVLSRDGDDAVVPGRALPGVPGISRPFRGLDRTGPALTAAQSSHSLEDTIFRTMPGQAKTANTDENPRGRQLFQVGTAAEHEAFKGAAVGGGVTDENTLDYDYKYRMLAKVMNNSTLRSNTFFVYLQADLFEAEIAPDGAVRIGAKLGNSPGYRGFFIIDRTKAMEMVKSIDVPNKRNTRSFSFNPNFNWRALVLHRQRLN